MTLTPAKAYGTRRIDAVTFYMYYHPDDKTIEGYYHWKYCYEIPKLHNDPKAFDQYFYEDPSVMGLLAHREAAHKPQNVGRSCPPFHL